DGELKYNFVMQNENNNGVIERVPEQIGNYFNLIPGNSISAFTHLNKVYYQEEPFYSKQGSNIYTLRSYFLNKKLAKFIISAINSIIGNLEYGKNTASRLIKYKIQLPTKNGKIDFEFMESFIAELEAERTAELEAYLLATGLKDYTLTAEEQKVLDDFDNLNWGAFNLEKLFGKSTRGKRLKSADRISGDLPFVTAGETDEGISAFIGNDVNVFSENTITIDMFGSAKYRNYKYGGDDHIAVVHTESLPKHASIFVTTAIHKSSYNGQFNYGRNFYAKDADVLNISLPVKQQEPDYEIMETFISAIQKLVIKEVVLFVDRKRTSKFI
ncbi:MAG TPA: restriction endonuclease subunit S, partial [Pyrinomonadaceae bacterium]